MSAGPTGPPPASGGVRPVRRRQTFERLRHSPNRGRSGPISVAYVEGNPWSKVEVAYVIGRRLGSAVTRNRLRRRLRAIVADAASSLPAGAYVVRAGPGAPELDFDELRMTVGRALERALVEPKERHSPAVPGLARSAR